VLLGCVARVMGNLIFWSNSAGGFTSAWLGNVLRLEFAKGVVDLLF